MEQEPLYRIFYIHQGKFFVSKTNLFQVCEAITKKHPDFKNQCKWFTFDQCQQIIKYNKTPLIVWGIVSENGKQLTVGEFDGVLKPS